MSTRWNYEYAPKFQKKIVNLNNPLAAHRIEKLCEWIADQQDPAAILHIKTCEEIINKKLFFVIYGWHIIYKFENQEIVFVMFYSDSENPPKKSRDD